MKHIVDRQQPRRGLGANAQRGATGMGPFVVPPAARLRAVHHHYGAASGGMPPRAGSSGGQRHDNYDAWCAPVPTADWRCAVSHLSGR